MSIGLMIWLAGLLINWSEPMALLCASLGGIVGFRLSRLRRVRSERGIRVGLGSAPMLVLAGGFLLNAAWFTQPGWMVVLGYWTVLFVAMELRLWRIATGRDPIDPA